MIVYKFGGSTTRTTKGLESLVEIVRTGHNEERDRSSSSAASPRKAAGLVLVVSAIGHTTRQLHHAAQLSMRHNFSSAVDQLHGIVASHLRMLKPLKLPEAVVRAITKKIERVASEVRELLEGISITEELTPRTNDLVSSAGERFAVILIEALLLERGIPVRSVAARNVIVTNDEFGHATPIVSETTLRARRRILPILRRGEVALIEGYVGATEENTVTTMGSESSDLTATLLGAALEADQVVIWKSVAGIFTADPELVPKAKLIRSLSFAESKEIGRRGARVLFSKASDPLVPLEFELPLRISSPNRSTTNASRARGTTISKFIQPSRSTPEPLAIGIEKELSLIRIVQSDRPTPTNTSITVVLSKSVPALIAELRSEELYAYTSGNEQILIRKELANEKLIAICAELDHKLLEHSHVAAISLVLREGKVGSDAAVGPNQLSNEAIRAINKRMLKALTRFHVMGFFKFEQTIIALVQKDEAERALQKLHLEFFE